MVNGDVHWGGPGSDGVTEWSGKGGPLLAGEKWKREGSLVSGRMAMKGNVVVLFILGLCRW